MSRKRIILTATGPAGSGKGFLLSFIQKQIEACGCIVQFDSENDQNQLFVELPKEAIYKMIQK